MFKKVRNRIYSPLSGKCVRMAELPDPVFASGMLGEGIGIRPMEDVVTVVAPMDGVATGVSDTGHAVGITAVDGKTAVLVHAGIDTVALGGVGFTLHVGEGEKVRRGQPILTMNATQVERAGYSSIVVVVLTESGTALHPVTKEQITVGEILFEA